MLAVLDKFGFGTLADAHAQLLEEDQERRPHRRKEVFRGTFPGGLHGKYEESIEAVRSLRAQRTLGTG